MQSFSRSAVFWGKLEVKSQSQKEKKNLWKKYQFDNFENGISVLLLNKKDTREKWLFFSRGNGGK